jgi:hypothetical protein
MRPQLDPASLHVLQQAVEALGSHRGIPCPLTDPGRRVDPGVAIHLLQSLILQAHHWLPGLIAACYDHGYTHTDIRALLGLTDTPLTRPPARSAP